jgi:hypothetical protein
VSLDKWRRHIRKGDLTKHVCITSTTPYIISESDIIDITTSTQNQLIIYTSNNSDDMTMEDTTTREDEVIAEEVEVIVEEVIVMDQKMKKLWNLNRKLNLLRKNTLRK